MTHKNDRKVDKGRRQALARLGLVLPVAYVAPVLLNLSQAVADGQGKGEGTGAPGNDKGQGGGNGKGGGTGAPSEGKGKDGHSDHETSPPPSLPPPKALGW